MVLGNRNIDICLFKALTLLRNLYREVTSVVKKQYSQATIVPHFIVKGLQKQPLKFVVEERCSRKCLLEIFFETSIKLFLEKAFREFTNFTY